MAPLSHYTSIIVHRGLGEVPEREGHRLLLEGMLGEGALRDGGLIRERGCGNREFRV